jgi:hypothetical protein
MNSLKVEEWELDERDAALRLQHSPLIARYLQLQAVLVVVAAVAVAVVVVVVVAAGRLAYMRPSFCFGHNIPTDLEVVPNAEQVVVVVVV